MKKFLKAALAALCITAAPVVVHSDDWTWNFNSVTSSHSYINETAYGLPVADHANGASHHGQYSNGGIVASFSHDWYVVNSITSPCDNDAYELYNAPTYKNCQDGVSDGCVAVLNAAYSGYTGPLTGSGDNSEISFDTPVRQLSFWYSMPDNDRQYICPADTADAICSGQLSPYYDAQGRKYCGGTSASTFGVLIKTAGNADVVSPITVTDDGDAFWGSHCSDGNPTNKLCHWRQFTFNCGCDDPSFSKVFIAMPPGLGLIDDIFVSTEQAPVTHISGGQIICDCGDCGFGAPGRAQKAKPGNAKANDPTKTSWGQLKIRYKK